MAEKGAVLSTEEQEMEEEKQNSEKDEESEEEESDDEEYFEVEKIMARKKRDGKFLYRVRWKGYPPSNDTWEPVDNLEVVLDMVEEYDAKEDQKTKARQEERRLRKLRMEGKKLPGEESSDDSSSSDDERLLSEDTKFFKMLEKNKDIVFGQPDLYSKVKSRTATLAEKKKTETKTESSAPASASAPAPKTPPEKKENGGGRGRGRPKGSSVQGKGAGRGRSSKKTVSEQSEDSDDSVPLAKKTAGRGRGRPRKKFISDSSEENEESDDSAPLKQIAGKGRGRPRKKTPVISDDSESDDEKGSDDASAKKPSLPVKSSGKKATATKTAPEKKPLKERKKRDVSSEKDSEKSSAESENDTQSDVVSKAKTAQSGTSGETVKVPSPKDVTDKGDKTGNHKCASSAATTAPSPKTVSAKSSAEEPSIPPTAAKSSPVHPRVVIPVLEKLAQGSVLKEMTGDKQEGAGSEVSAPSAGSTEDKGEKKKAGDRETQSKGIESMEVETCEQKQHGKGKRKGSSRKRKQDTAAEHAKVVNEGGASPAKAMTPLSPCSPVDSSSTVTETTSSPVPMETSTQPTRQGDLDNDDATLPISSPMRKVTLEKKVPPLKITVPKLKINPSKLKPESPKSHSHSPKFLVDVDKSEKARSKGDSVKSGSVSRDQSTSGGVDKPSVKPTQSLRPPAKESLRVSASSELLRSSSPSAATGAVAGTGKKDVSGKAVGVTGVCHNQNSAGKSDLMAKPARSEGTSSKYVKPEPVVSKIARTESVDRGGRSELTARPDAVDAKRRFSTDAGSSKEFSSPSGSATARDPTSSLFSSMSSSVRDVSGTGRDSTLPAVSRESSSRETSGLFSSSSTSRETLSLFSTSSTSRDTSSLYSSVRDISSGRGTSLSSASPRDQSFMSTSFRDSHLTTASSRDLHLGSGSSRDFHMGSGSGRDIHLSSGYIHLTSASSRDSSYTSPSTRDLYGRGDPKGSPAGGSRHGLNSSISGKENADRQPSYKSFTAVPKKGDGVQPLDTILNSSLYSGEGDKARQYKGLDSDFELALQRIDLEYLEKLLLPPVTPMELSDEELRQAVIDGNCYLVERALASPKPYNLDLPDNKGYTLLMNAVIRGSDDVIVHLLSRGADAQVQVNGSTALMLAVEHAESSTVYMLLEMGAHVNTADLNGETALFKAVKRGDKQILKLILDHGANFTLTTRSGLSPLQMAKQFRLADIETTIIDHIQRVVRAFEEQVNLTVRGTAKLVSCLFPHHCVPLYESDTINIPFKYQPTLPSGPGMGCLLFIAHARFSSQDVKCRLYGQCAVEKVTLNGVSQPCLTEESNFVLMCHPLIAGWNELVIHTRKDTMSRAKLIVCAYKAQLICK